MPCSPAAMIRIQEAGGWTLVGHQLHARLAGQFAVHWGNSDFAPPEPRADILVAVARHDDAWAARDAQPALTREGRPGAYSHELVGSYSAFEEIDLADYLAVRGRATEAVARDNPYAAILISMHTVNLLTEQADLRGLAPEKLQMHRDFIEGQLQRQRELSAIAATSHAAAELEPTQLRRAFEFLQFCDNLSLITCVRYPKPLTLRHRHPRSDGESVALVCTPLSATHYRVAPYPFDQDELNLKVPARRLTGATFADQAALRAAYAAAPVENLEVVVVR
jgi:Protein of unknown function (DUF3891)